MKVDVLIPWQGDCVYRKLNLDWVCDKWRSYGYEPIIGVQPEGEMFTKSVAVDAAIEQSDADVFIITDGDLWADEIFTSIEDVTERRHPWSMPHHMINRMDPAQTSRVISGAPFGPPLTQRPYRGVLGGGIAVVRRDVYKEAPLDPRFVGWGQEDESWGFALRTLFRNGRIGRGDLWHLWHPPANRKNRRTGTNEGMKLRNRYMMASRQGPEVMRALIAEV